MCASIKTLEVGGDTPYTYTVGGTDRLGRKITKIKETGRTYRIYLEGGQEITESSGVVKSVGF